MFFVSLPDGLGRVDGIFSDSVQILFKCTFSPQEFPGIVAEAVQLDLAEVGLRDGVMV